MRPGVREISDFAFYRCAKLREMRVPEGVTTIGAAAFGECTGLLRVHLPASLTFIGSCAFSNCKGLEEVEIPANLRGVTSGAFEGVRTVKRLFLLGAPVVREVLVELEGKLGRDARVFGDELAGECFGKYPVSRGKRTTIDGTMIWPFSLKL
jgi:hypothetical protein